MPSAQGHITIRRKAKDGENAVRLDLDNEHEDFIYNDVGALLSFYVTSQAHLYDGSAEVPSGNVTWSIDRSGTNGTEVENSGLPIMEDDEPNEWWSKNCCWITTGGKLYVIGINGDAYIKVKAVYKGKTYYALFYGKRISEDKYELVISRKSISFNESRAWTAQTIEFSVNRTSKDGSKQDGIALDFGNGISLSIFAKYRTSEGSEASWHKVNPNNTGRLCVLTVNNDIVRYNDEIQIELRKGMSMSSYVEDYENIPILKAKDGERGLEGCILRVSEWAEGVEYHNDEALTSGTRYLDIAVVTKGPNTFDAYKCKQTHTSSDSILVNNTTYWEKFNKLQPVYTPLIMAQNALLRFAQTNQLLVMKSDSTTVAAGMGGGGNVQESENYPLWVGAETPANAPFKVRIDGKLFATGAEISGVFVSENAAKMNKIVIDSNNLGIRLYGPSAVDVNNYSIPAEGAEYLDTIIMGYEVDPDSRRIGGYIQLYDTHKTTVQGVTKQTDYSLLTSKYLRISDTSHRIEFFSKGIAHNSLSGNFWATWEDIIKRTNQNILPVTSVTSERYNATQDDVIIISNYNGQITINLPLPSNSQGKFYFIKHKANGATYVICENTESANLIMDDDDIGTVSQRSIGKSSTLFFCDGEHWIAMELDY